MTGDEITALQVALKLNPPPDGYYDDEQTQTRYCVRGGVVRMMIPGRDVRPLDCAPWTTDKQTSAMSRPWNTYMMLP